MKILDVNTFFAPKAGGIRTYHCAKLEWFEAQSEHRYFLVAPGPRNRRFSRGPCVQHIEVYGPRVGRDGDGYRLIIDYRAVVRLIEEIRPDVVEVGDT